MKTIALSLSILSAVLLGSLRVASADPVPVQGTRELRLGNSLGILSMYAPGVNVLSPEQGSNMTLASFGAGLGYFVTDNVELGGDLSYFYISSGGSMQGPGLAAFARLYTRTGQLGLFLEPVLEFQYLSDGTVSEKILGPGADAGFEVFLTDSWALRLSPTFRYYKEWASRSGASASTSVTKLGVNWGIAAYF
jgi:hypothetical protein